MQQGVHQVGEWAKMGREKSSSGGKNKTRMQSKREGAVYM